MHSRMLLTSLKKEPIFGRMKILLKEERVDHNPQEKKGRRVFAVQDQDFSLGINLHGKIIKNPFLGQLQPKVEPDRNNRILTSYIILFQQTKI